MENEQLLNTILEKITRLETKVTSSLKNQGFSTTKEEKENSVKPEKIFMKVDNECNYKVYLRHTDITIQEINNFLQDKIGEYEVLLNDKVLWKIVK